MTSQCLRIQRADSYYKKKLGILVSETFYKVVCSRTRSSNIQKPKTEYFFDCVSKAKLASVRNVETVFLPSSKLLPLVLLLAQHTYILLLCTRAQQTTYSSFTCMLFNCAVCLTRFSDTLNFTIHAPFYSRLFIENVYVYVKKKNFLLHRLRLPSCKYKIEYTNEFEGIHDEV